MVEAAPDGPASRGPVSDGPAGGEGDGPVIDRLRQDVARMLDRPAAAIGDQDDLLDLGLDSIRLMSLLQSWSQPGRELDLVDFADDPRLASWAPRVAAAAA